MTEKIYTKDSDLASLADAKDWLRIHAKKGARCPCCKQFVKIYRRPLGSQMARWLIWLVRTWETLNVTTVTTWVDVKRSPVRGGDYAKLVHWGLIEQKEKDSDDTKRKDSGLWRPTFKGLDFVAKRCVVPSHVFLYDSIKLKDEQTKITIIEALGEKFDYQELMRAPIDVQVPV